MRKLARIEATWIELDHALEGETADLTPDARGKVLDQQIVDDQAYFIPCWGQSEVEITDPGRDVVRKRRSHDGWQIRRAWDLYNLDEHRLSGLSFENRATLVLDGQAGRGGASALTVRHCGVRHQIAHGNLQATRIDVSAFVGHHYTIQSALHRAS